MLINGEMKAQVRGWGINCKYGKSEIKSENTVKVLSTLQPNPRKEE